MSNAPWDLQQVAAILLREKTRVPAVSVRSVSTTSPHCEMAGIGAMNGSNDPVIVVERSGTARSGSSAPVFTIKKEIGNVGTLAIRR